MKLSELIEECDILKSDNILKISEIAEKLQFNDEYYFSHFFRRESGISPSSFRRKILHL